MSDELTFPTEWAHEPEWKTIAKDYEGQVAYLLRRCLVAEEHEPDDLEALEALIADADNVGRL